MDGGDKLNGMLEDLAEAGEEGDVSLGELVEALEARGFGPLLMMLSAFLILPTGMIPGMPAAVGLLLIVVAGQILLGRNRLWLPARLHDFSVSSRLILRSVDKARPAAAFLARSVSARITALVDHPLARRAVALTVMATGAILIPLGFIPFLPLALAVNVLLFGLGMTMRNGLITLLGFASFAPGVWLAASGLF